MKQPLANLGRRHAARGAGQQPQAKPLLETANDVTERRRRDAELCCGPREAAFPRNGQKNHEIVRVPTFQIGSGPNFEIPVGLFGPAPRFLAALEPRQVNERARELTRV